MTAFLGKISKGQFNITIEQNQNFFIERNESLNGTSYRSPYIDPSVQYNHTMRNQMSVVPRRVKKTFTTNFDLAESVCNNYDDKFIHMQREKIYDDEMNIYA